MIVERTKHYSYKAGELAKGCKLCIRGEKLVLFITGLCTSRCDFCPVSDKKLYKDVTYANERPIENLNQVLNEAKICKAKGAGITGGDPLIKLDRTTEYIKTLKKKFGNKFHIHLYAPLKLVNKKSLLRLYESGLDEIRFHPDLNKKDEWSKIGLAKNFEWDVGVEIPAIPGREEQTKKLIDYIKGKVDFLNINELEVADNAVWRNKKSIKCKDKVSYAIKGSDELAKKLLKYAASKGMRTHYCTCKLKDAVQLARRIKRRASNAKHKFDVLTKEGMLIRGALYPPELVPGFGYHEKLNQLRIGEKKKILNKLRTIQKRIIKEEKIPEDMIIVDENKPRLITSRTLIKRIKNKDLVRAIVTEYPTFDALEIEVELI